MAYEWAVKNDDPENPGDDSAWFDGPKIVLVVTGAHDCSRLIQTLDHGVTEQSRVARKIAASMNRKPLGRRVTELLKRHGGTDLTRCGTTNPEPKAGDQ